MCPPAMNSMPTISSSSDIFKASYIAKSLKAPATPPTTMKRAKSSTDKTKKLLPIDFEPSEYSIICGNKRAFFNSVGNRRFRVICQMHLEEFMTAPTKHEKSFVVTKVMKTLRDAAPNGVAFVAFEKGRWWQVSDRTSREKVGTFFRDCLADSYKSSSKNKIAQRRIKRTQCSSPPSSPLPKPTLVTMPVPTTPAASAPAAIVSPPPPLEEPTATTRWSIVAATLALPPAFELDEQPEVEPVPFTAASATQQRWSIVTSPLFEAVAAALEEDDASVGSSTCASFYDVDDLTPVPL